MTRHKSISASLSRVCWIVFLIFASGQAVFAQSSRIPPEYVDDWFYDRVWYTPLLGALFGLMVVTLWLPRLLPSPHQNDKKRARLRFFISLILSALVLGVLLLLDVSLNYQFGNRAYNFSETFSQAWLTWRLFALVLLGLLTFTLIAAAVTRASSKFYRYILIPW